MLQEQLSEAQISGILKDNSLKDAELDKSYNLQEAELEKQWGYEVTRDTDNSIILGASTGLGKIDKDIDVTERTTIVTEEQHADNLVTTGKQQLLLDEELETAGLQQLLLTTEEEIKTAQLAEISAATTRTDAESAKKVLLMQEQIDSEELNNKVDGMLENQILKIKEDVQVAIEQVAIAKTQTATEQANSIANIDKVLGYEYTLDLDGNIVVGATTNVGKLDYEKDLIKEQTESEALNNEATDGMMVNQILKIKEDINVAQEQVAIAKTQTATEKSNSIANIDKVLGYDYTLDGNDNIIVGTDTQDGKLDYETALMKEQTKITYTDRVLKDKQTSKLGLDNTMKLSEASRESDANFKYSPNYTDPGA